MMKLKQYFEQGKTEADFPPDFHPSSSGVRQAIDNDLNIKPIKEFGINYAGHYHGGESAIQKLINEAQAHKESGAKGELQGRFIVKN